MELIYLTSKQYPSRTADHFFAKEMALAFGELLKDKLTLVLANDFSEFFKEIKVVTTGLKNERGRTLYYFFWLPLFIIKNGHNKKDTHFFSNDPNLLVNLIVLRKIFRFKYKVCSEWHMLFDDWRDKFIVKNSDFLVVTSHILKGTILKGTGVIVRPERFLVVYGGVDVKKYGERDNLALRRELNLPENKILIAYIGLFKTLGTSKGIDTMVGALRYLPENVNMIFVGGRKEEIDDYKDKMTDTNLRERCIFVEKQDNQRVPLYQMAVDILVIPSPNKPPFSNYLLPMKVYEYMASKKPIVFSNLPILREALGDCGFSFIPEDSKDLAEKISHIINDESGDVRQKIDLCCSKAGESSWAKRAEKIVGFFNKMMIYY